MGLEEFNNLTEILSRRGYNRKVYDLGDGQKRYRFHIAHKHYKDEYGNFQDIDTALAFDDTAKTWKHNKASYHPTIPEYADDWFEFYNAYEGANHTLKAKPICNHVQGVAFDNSEGRGVLYTDAFGTGIDLKVYAYWAGLKKVIILREKPADVSQDLTFDFELQLPSPSKDKVKDKDGNVWDKQAKLNFKNKVLKIGEDGKESYFRNASIWDSNNSPEGIRQPVDIELYVQGGKIYLRKTIKAEILQKAVYPLYTDHPTSYYAGAGDGFSQYYSGSTNWDTCHNGTAGTYTDYTSEISGFGATRHTTIGYTVIKRGFFPINTSGIDDDATITAATLYLYVDSIIDTDNDTYDYGNIVQTSQASNSALVNEDYDTCGATHSPTLGSDNLDIGSMSVPGYNSWALNATALTWIDKVNANNTLLGIREGHDLADHPIEGTNGSGNFVNCATSEDTSGTKDPYLDVTTGGGGGTITFAPQPLSLIGVGS